MFRLFCLFTHDGLYLIRANSTTANLWTTTVAELSQDAITNAIREKDPSVTLKGLALLKTITLPLTNTFRACAYVVAEVKDGETFKRQLGDVLQWQWLMFSDITALKNNETVDKATHQVVQMVETRDLVSTDMLELKSTSKTEELCQLNIKEFERTLHEAQRTLKLNAGFGKKEVSMLYEVFMAYSWPCDTIGWDEFNTLMAKIPIRDGDDLPALFRSFAYLKNGRLTFTELALGLAAMQPNTSHGNVTGDQRTRYIFRYYCSDKDGHGAMKVEELEMLLRHINRARPSYSDPTAEAKRLFHEPFTYDVLLGLVGKLQLRGTSNLFRLEDNFMVTFRKTSLLNSDSPRRISLMNRSPNEDTTTTKPIDTPNAQATTQTSSANSRGAKRELPSAVVEPIVQKKLSCRDITTQTVSVDRMDSAAGNDHDFADCQPSTSGETQYSVAVHAIRPTENGPIEEQLVDIGDCLTQRTRFEFESNESFNPDKAISAISRHAREMQRGLNFFARRYSISTPTINNGKREMKPYRSWHEVNMKAVGKCFVDLASALVAVFCAEPRCLQLPAPAYLLGDIHGNFADLTKFEEYLWPLGPKFCAGKLLFLGDYVDRGKYQFEVVAYLFAQKALAPDQVFLLRGNHEMSSVNQAMSSNFRKECEQKFGFALGKQVWQAANECFDCMPLAAVVDDKIFCVHGGLPHPKTYDTTRRIVESINKIQTPLSATVDLRAEYPIDSALAWGLLWNDPVFDDDMVEFDDCGFGPNRIRGNAQVFSAAALQTFLDEHHFSHVVRAHQVRKEGFQVQYSSQLLTVFSSSSYLGMDNSAACILAADGHLSVLRIVTRSAGTVTPGTQRTI